MSSVETNLKSEHGAEDSRDSDKNTAPKQTYKTGLLDHGKRGPEEHGDRDKHKVKIRRDAQCQDCKDDGG